MDRTIRVAAVGDNCIDAYDKLGRAYPGGNPVNVAVYIKRMGGEASYTGAVGSDQNGELMKTALSAKGIDISHVKVLKGKTAVSHVEIIEGDRVFGDYEEGVLADFKLQEEDFPFLASHDIVVSGIWGMIENDLKQIHGLGVRTAFDFANKFISPVVEQAIPYVDYAFFSFDREAGEVFKQAMGMMGLEQSGDDGKDLRSFMSRILEKGPKAVVVTLGEKGSLAFDGDRFCECGIVPCKVVDTMGAGDSYIAGFLYGILQGMEIEEAMLNGAKAGSETLGYSGAW